MIINNKIVREKNTDTGETLYHRHFIIMRGTSCGKAYYTSDNEQEEGKLTYFVPDAFAEPVKAAMDFYRNRSAHKVFEKACREQKPGIDVTIIIKATRALLFEQYKNSVNEQKKQNMQSESVSQPQPTVEKKVPKKVHKGPDPVAMLNREKEYVLRLCSRLEAKYGKAEFGAPAAEGEISQWEEENQVVLPEDLKEWLKFSGASKLKGIPLEFYPIAQFRKEQDYVVIGKRENAQIGFSIENGRYLAVENEKRRNLGQMETILRFWGYDAKELFAEEELEALRPVIEEHTMQMNQAKQKANMSLSVKDAMEYFFARNTIGSLKKWRSFPKCPVRKELVDCGLVISEPDRDGYYQWKPVEQTIPVDFTGIESKLGFNLHPDIKAFVSSYYYFMLDADIKDAGINIYPFLPTVNVGKYLMDRFEKESYAGDYAFILNGHFFQLGGACIDGDDSYILEVNNETGEVLAVEYMDKKHIKIADSLYDLFMNAKPGWYEG